MWFEICKMVMVWVMLKVVVVKVIVRRVMVNCMRRLCLVCGIVLLKILFVKYGVVVLSMLMVIFMVMSRVVLL